VPACAGLALAGQGQEGHPPSRPRAGTGRDEHAQGDAPTKRPGDAGKVANRDDSAQDAQEPVHGGCQRVQPKEHAGLGAVPVYESSRKFETYHLPASATRSTGSVPMHIDWGAL